MPTIWCISKCLIIFFVFLQFDIYHIMKTFSEYFSSLLNMTIFCRDIEDEKSEESKKTENKESEEKDKNETNEFFSWFSRRQTNVKEENSSMKEESLDEKNKNEDETFKLIDVFEKPGDENVNEMFKTNF